MRRLAVLVVCGALVALGVARCGSGGSKLGACYNPAGQTCTGVSTYESCIIGKCDAKLKACYGDGYQAHSYGGPCAKMIECSTACTCDSTYGACAGKCTSNLSAACTTCLTDLGHCTNESGCKPPACTAGTGTGTGTGGSSLGGCHGTTGQTCTGTAEYESCVIYKCDVEFTTCYGSGYQSGTFSGPCAAVLQCMATCKCDATYQACATGCASKLTAACQTCAPDVGTCVAESGCKPPVCTGSGTGTGTGTGSGSGSGNCSTLATCCATIKESLKEPCDLIVSQGDETVCSQAYASWNTAGYCQ
jgi:hypothetical protein